MTFAAVIYRLLRKHEKFFFSLVLQLILCFFEYLNAITSPFNIYSLIKRNVYGRVSKRQDFFHSIIGKQAFKALPVAALLYVLCCLLVVCFVLFYLFTFIISSFFIFRKGQEEIYASLKGSLPLKLSMVI